MRTKSETKANRLVILAGRARFMANGRVRLVEVPWIYEVVRLEGRLRSGDGSRKSKPPCTAKAKGARGIRVVGTTTETPRVAGGESPIAAAKNTIDT